MSHQALGRDLWLPLCPPQAAEPGRNLPGQTGCTLSRPTEALSSLCSAWVDWRTSSGRCRWCSVQVGRRLMYCHQCNANTVQIQLRVVGERVKVHAVFSSLVCEIRGLRNEQPRTKHRTLSDWAQHLNDGWQTAVIHDLKRSAGQVRPKPLQNCTTQAKLAFEPE